MDTSEAVKDKSICLDQIWIRVEKLMSKKSLIDNLKEIYYAFSKKLSMNYDVLSKFIDENKTKNNGGYSARTLYAGC